MAWTTGQSPGNSLEERLKRLAIKWEAKAGPFTNVHEDGYEEKYRTQESLVYERCARELREELGQ